MGDEAVFEQHFHPEQGVALDVERLVIFGARILGLRLRFLVAGLLLGLRETEQAHRACFPACLMHAFSPPTFPAPSPLPVKSPF